MQPIKTAFFSGTFNPVHTGHLILANYLCEYEGFDEIWLSVSPQNPLREKLSSNNDRQRIEMLNMAVNGNSKIRTTDIEFTLPRPSYTIQTLEALTYRADKNNDNNKNFFIWIKLRINSKYNSRQA